MIELKEVTKEYSKGIAALNGINLRIEQGEFVFVVGDSGSGKSTLIRLLMKEIERKCLSCPCSAQAGLVYS